MIILVVSDFHLGKGRFFKNGELNILEDFNEDQHFFELCEYYVQGEYKNKEVKLVLNGDILNLIQVDVQGIFHHLIDENITIKALQSIVKGHPVFFEGLKAFLKESKKKLIYVIGNHDNGMAFPKVQDLFNELVGGEVEFCHEWEENGVHIEHGHQFESINTVPKEKFFINGPNGKKILNLPWGSLFCIRLIPSLKKDRPYIDKVRPMNSYIKWLLFHDFFFAIKFAYSIGRYFFLSNFAEYTRHMSNFKTTISVLKQITMYPLYSRKARAIMKRNKDIHTVVMGHTHIVEWRRYPEGKSYFNTGTWNSIPSIDAGLHEPVSKMTYVYLQLHPKSKAIDSGCLNTWQGNWRPYIEEAKIST